MKRFLANENFPGDAVRLLRGAGYDVVWICEETPGITDQMVLARAVAECRVLLTFDKDFGELAFQSHLPATCGVVLFRVSMRTPHLAIQHIVHILASRDSWAGTFAVVEESRIRMRALK